MKGNSSSHIVENNIVEYLKTKSIKCLISN